MQMTPAAVHTNTGETIALHIVPMENKTLLECQESEAFLNHITRGRWTSSLSPDITLRGVVIPGEGAFFQLFDQFGAVSGEIANLNGEEARTLLSELW